MTDTLCIISTKAPYDGQSAREALDAALVAASYDIPTALLLMGDGVYQIKTGQQPGQLPRKNLSAMFQALPLYGIETVYIDQSALAERGLNEADLQPPYTCLTEDQLATLIQQHPKVLSF